MDLNRMSGRAGLRMILLIVRHMLHENEKAEEREQLDSYVRKPAPPPPLQRELLSLLALAEYRWRRTRQRYFDSDLFGEPAWDMLLDLYVQEAKGKRVSITSACTASHVPPTTALRWIGLLVQQELVFTEDDTTDHRRRFLSLTQKGRAKLEGYLADQVGSDSRPDSWLFARAPRSSAPRPEPETSR